MRAERRTLDHWKVYLSSDEFVIECSGLRLIGRDGEGEIFSGPGRIKFARHGKIEFWIYASSADHGRAFEKLRESEAAPYDALSQMRLIATDFRGQEWHGGYCSVRVQETQSGIWFMYGEAAGLSVETKAPWCRQSPSVELIFLDPLGWPLSEWSETIHRFEDEVVEYSRQSARQILHVLGSEIHFEKDRELNALWVVASTSDALCHPYLERWLSEPLRVLSGALVYPTAFARNFGDGRSSVTFMPTPKIERPSKLGLYPPNWSIDQKSETLWALYGQLLCTIARGNDLEPHAITRLYEELAQANQGSRWVLILTLASAIESLAKAGVTPADIVSEYPAEVLHSMEAYLRSWSGDKNLRSRMLSSLALSKKRSVQSYLRELAKAGKITPLGVDAWMNLRNSVMHGELVEPWATAQGDAQLGSLVDLFHDLTRLLIDQNED